MALACSHVDKRTRRPTLVELDEDMRAACKIVGLEPAYLGTFDNLLLAQTPHHELVKYVEDAYLDFEPELVFVHASSDMNKDHGALSEASLVATRIFQRRNMNVPIRKVLAVEVSSSTDWGITPCVDAFSPTTFVPVEEQDLDAKLRALACYREVMRPHPHPRSDESLRARAIIRGSQCGSHYAEAFQLMLEIGL